MNQVENKQELTFKDVSVAVTDLVVAASTLASAAALVALTLFKTIGLPAVVTKGAALLGGAVLLSHPIGWGILLLGVVIGGVTYMGYRTYQASKEYMAECEEEEKKASWVKESEETLEIIQNFAGKKEIEPKKETFFESLFSRFSPRKEEKIQISELTLDEDGVDTSSDPTVKYYG